MNVLFRVLVLNGHTLPHEREHLPPLPQILAVVSVAIGVSALVARRLRLLGLVVVGVSVKVEE